MTIDVMDQIGAVRRELRTGERDGKETKILVATQSYDSGIDDVWDALTSAERIPRWLLPITGDLRLGGRYQLEGNAGGEIQECEPPQRLAVTWEYAGEPTWVVVRLTATEPERTTLELEHTAVVPEEMWPAFGPGAVGIGWDLTLLGLTHHLSDAANEPLGMDWPTTDGGRAFMTESSEAWGEAAIAAGEDPDVARAAAARATAFYTTPDPANQAEGETPG